MGNTDPVLLVLVILVSVVALAMFLDLVRTHRRMKRERLEWERRWSRFGYDPASDPANRTGAVWRCGGGGMARGPQPAKPNTFDSWLPKSEVVAQTGLGLRTVERLTAKGTLRHAHRRVPGRKPFSVVHPEDVAKLKAETLAPQPAPRVPEVVRPKAPPPSRALTIRQPAQLSPLREVAPVRVTEKLFLTIPEAVALSGLPAAYLRRLLTAGRLKAVRAGGWCIWREGLHDLRPPDPAA